MPEEVSQDQAPAKAKDDERTRPKWLERYYWERREVILTAAGLDPSVPDPEGRTPDA